MKATIKRVRRWMWMPLALFALLIVGTSQGGGGVTGTGSVALGGVEDFGSVFVNGIEYFTDTANVVIDGAAASDSQLRVGMVVRVDGLLSSTGTTGAAATVTYDPDIRGALDAAPAAIADGYVLTVGGVAITTSHRTFVDGALDAGQLAAGDRIEVSGLRDDNVGGITALRVAAAANLSAGTVLSGRIRAVTPAGFVLGAITVTYENSLLRNGTTLTDGMVVRVKSASDPANGMLAADEVRVLDGNLRAAAGTEGSAQGVVSGLATSAFSLSGVRVAYGPSTRFVNGTAANLANGALLSVEGVVDAAGGLSAEKITFPAPDASAAEAVVSSIASSGFTLVSPDGVQVLVRTDTRWRDRSSLDTSNLSLAKLRVGDRVQVAGAEVAEGVMSADGVTRINAAPGVVLVGRARTSLASAVSILSVQTVTTGSTRYQDVDGSSLTADQFFGKAVGRTVKATGVVSGADVIASLLEIEP